MNNIKYQYKVFKEVLHNIYEVREAINIADIVFEEFVGISKTKRLISDFNLDEEKIALLNQIKTDLLNHKPLQQILGYEYFFNRKYKINEHVLIPRPETEELVKLIIDENKSDNEIEILDIGSGSGCISISLKLNLPNASITSIDISKEALNIANENAKELAANVSFLEMDFLQKSNWIALKKYDIIVSNPPYISSEEKQKMRKNVLDFEPHIALFTPNDDVLIFYKKIADFALTHLNKNGKIYCELNEHLGIETKNIFTEKGFETFVIKDFQQKDRIIKAK